MCCLPITGLPCYVFSAKCKGFMHIDCQIFDGCAWIKQFDPLFALILFGFSVCMCNLNFGLRNEVSNRDRCSLVTKIQPNDVLVLDRLYFVAIL